MPTAFFFTRDGKGSTKIEVSIGTSLMAAAAGHCIEGIIADCGGQMSCATCHVVVEPAFADLLPPIGDAENQILDFTAMPREPNSRLSCQVVMTESLDGISVRIADPQQ